MAGIALTLLALSAMAGGLVYYTYYGRPKAGGTGKPKPSETSATRQVAGNDSEKDASKPKASTDDSDASGQRRGRKKDREPVDPTSDRAVSTMKPPSRERDRVRPSRSEREPDETDDPIGAATAAIAVPPPPPMRAADAGGPAEVMSAEEKPSRQEQAAGPPAAVVAVKDAKLDAMLAEVLEAMRRQEDDTVARLLGMASKQATGRAAKERVAGWQQLATYYKGFLGYREQAMAAVKPGNEYDVKNQKVGVVEVDDDTFVYRVAGGNKTVPRDKIPAGIVLAIVMEWFDENPANELYLGAYHLAKPEPDPKRAREHWDKALAGGADASGLIPLLDDPVFAASE